MKTTHRDTEDTETNKSLTSVPQSLGVTSP